LHLYFSTGCLLIYYEKWISFNYEGSEVDWLKEFRFLKTLESNWTKGIATKRLLCSFDTYVRGLQFDETILVSGTVWRSEWAHFILSTFRSILRLWREERIHTLTRIVFLECFRFIWWKNCYMLCRFGELVERWKFIIHSLFREVNEWMSALNSLLDFREISRLLIIITIITIVINQRCVTS
jgi:hypothetical protein